LSRIVCDTSYPHSRRIYALQLPHELAAFLALVRSARARRILEIGTAAGGTLFMICRAAADDAKILSVDLPGGDFGGGYEPLRVPIYRRFARRGQSIELLRADSHAVETVDRVRKIFEPIGGLDLAFVDGDHTCAGVERDFDLYWPLIRPGGMLAFHDVNPGDSRWGGDVPQFWRRIRDRGRAEELVEMPEGGGFGIGVLWKE
jgi:predicted O-methyltransferase YrrM